MSVGLTIPLKQDNFTLQASWAPNMAHTHAKVMIFGIVRVWRAVFQLTELSYMHRLRCYSRLTGTANLEVRHRQFGSSSPALRSVGFLAHWAFHICQLAFLAPKLVQLHCFYLKWDSLNRFWTFSSAVRCSDGLDTSWIYYRLGRPYLSVFTMVHLHRILQNWSA